MTRLSAGDQEAAGLRWGGGPSQQSQACSGGGPKRGHGGDAVLERFAHRNFSNEIRQVDVLIAQP